MNNPQNSSLQAMVMPWQGLLETLKHELGQQLPATDPWRMLTPILILTGAMWDYLNECIDYENARIYEYFNREADELLNA